MEAFVSAQFDVGKGLRIFFEKNLSTPSYGAIGAAHKSAIGDWGVLEEVFIGRWEGPSVNAERRGTAFRVQSREEEKRRAQKKKSEPG